MRSFRLLLIAAAAAAPLAGTAHASWKCSGLERAKVCYDLNTGGAPGVGSTPFEECVYVNNVCRVPISVPIPHTTPGNGAPILSVTCGGDSIRCVVIEVP